MAIARAIYFIKDVEQIIGRNRLTLRRWWEIGKFPRPVLIRKRIAWRPEVIEQWIKDNTNEII